jgi:hypothetical protein
VWSLGGPKFKELSRRKLSSNMPPKKKKTPKLLPGQSLLGIVKTPAPKKYRKVIAAHHPSVQGATHSGDREHGGMIYRSVSPEWYIEGGGDYNHRLRQNSQSRFHGPI